MDRLGKVSEEYAMNIGADAAEIKSQQSYLTRSECGS